MEPEQKVEKNPEQKVEKNPEQKVETKEELRKRLKKKIREKRTNRVEGITREKNSHLNDSIRKLSEILANRNIERPDQIDNQLVQTIMNVINKKDLELILKHMQQNTLFKDLLTNINDRYTN